MVVVSASPPDSIRLRLAHAALPAAASAGLCWERISRANRCTWLGTALAVVTACLQYQQSDTQDVLLKHRASVRRSLHALSSEDARLSPLGIHPAPSPASVELCAVCVMDRPGDQCHDAVHVSVCLWRGHNQGRTRCQAGPQLVNAGVKVGGSLLEEHITGGRSTSKSSGMLRQEGRQCCCC